MHARPVSAAVVPRVVSPTTHESIPLVDELIHCFESKDQFVQICGKGASMAVAYAALELKDHQPELTFLVNPSLSELRIDPPDRVVFCSNRSIPSKLPRLVLHLSPWSKDDLIEYLVAKHPAQCKSVMSRLANAEDDWIADGDPDIWTVVLESMVADESLMDPSDVVFDFVQKQLVSPGLFEQVSNICIHTVLNDRSLERLYRVKPRLSSKLLELLSSLEIRIVIAAEQIAKRLSSAQSPLKHSPSFLQAKWPSKLLELVAGRIASDQQALDRLKFLAKKRKSKSASTVASLMVAIDKAWRPPVRNRTNLKNARLIGANWQGVHLASASLDRCDFRDANLERANLSKANAMHAVFTGAQLHQADFRKAVLDRADFSGANASRLYAARAQFLMARLQNADLQNADLYLANLAAADLTKANFDGALLTRANLAYSAIEDASFRGATLHETNFSNLDLRYADFSSAICKDTILRNVIWEDCVLKMEFLVGANLSGAVLTGTAADRLRMNDCNLRFAKLADINWEECDLRGADFSHCLFHMGSTRCGLVDSPYPSHGTRTGFYTDDFSEQYFKRPEEIRKASLRGCDLRGAYIFDADFYLVDLRDAIYTQDQQKHFANCQAILKE